MPHGRTKLTCTTWTPLARPWGTLSHLKPQTSCGPSQEPEQMCTRMLPAMADSLSVAL